MSHREVPREMSNRMIIQTGGGLLPDRRSLRIGRGGMSLCLMFGLLVSASTALAAEIVEVRVGRHAEFTRVVFELDRAAGYRIERADPTSDVAELVVSLEASSIPRRIQSSKSLIVQVEVEPSGSRSIARIRLAKDGLRLKEMILASPPRIVLDVFSDQPIVAKPAKTTTVASKPAPAPAPTPAKSPSKSAREPIVVPAEAVPSLDEPTFEQIVAQLPSDTETVAPTVVAEADEAKAEDAKPPMAVVDEPTISTPLGDSILADAGEIAEAPSMETSGDEVDSQAMAVAEPEPAAPTRRPRPMVVQTKPAKDEGTGWMTWALVGGGAVLLLVGGLLVARRIGGGEQADFSDDDVMGFGDGENASAAQAGNDENPFGSLGSDGQQMTLGGSDETGSTATAVLAGDEEKESESVVFGDSEENSMEDMEVISREQVNESLGGMPAAAGGIPEEFQQMMREMSLRVESLEGRIDELVDARDRLERQVAAQTEELRVQRAAIARTQRAVRNLARPEEGEGEGEQEPTEPALRDPK
jgi:hypothetical protein